MGELDRALEGEPLAVDPESIEAKLRELWRIEGERADEAVSRAALWNVVAIGGDEERRARMGAILAAVSEAIPHRAILISADADARSPVNAWISAACHRVADRAEMCSEQIVLEAGRERVGNLASLARALLLPDMPVAFWWGGGPPGEPELLGLTSAADLLVFDSRELDSAGPLDVAERFAERCRLGGGDLEWIRIEPWRRAAAAAFDCPGVRARSGDIASVRIRSGASPDPRRGERAGASLFGGWIEAQLHLPRGTALIEEEPAHPAGELHSVVFDFGAGADLHLDLRDGVVRGSPEGMEQAAPIAIPLRSHEPPELVRKILSREGRDVVYDRALRAMK